MIILIRTCPLLFHDIIYMLTLSGFITIIFFIVSKGDIILKKQDEMFKKKLLSISNNVKSVYNIDTYT